LIAYFSMEVGLETDMPTYAGGLGVLAGDTLRSAADLGLPVVAVTLLYRDGYFRQKLAPNGAQREEPMHWEVERFAEPLAPRVRLVLCGRDVEVRAWRYRIAGVGGDLSVYLLDTDLPGNDPADRALTGALYGGDERYRLAQEAVLGIGGVRMLRALGHDRIERFHLNEGHAALAVLALAEEGRPLADVRRACVFTTHTPVPAGHDRFPAALVREVLGSDAAKHLAELGQRDTLNQTELALAGAEFVNAVALRHAEVSRGMFPGHAIRAITNGIHPGTWAAPPIAALFDTHIPEWRRDASLLRHAAAIPPDALAAAHAAARRALVDEVRRATGADLDPAAFTLGFARRATAYKRATLVLSDLDRLAAIAKGAGPLQLVFAGKAHPRDEEGKALIREIHAAAERLRGRVALVYLPGYDMRLGRLLCAGSDVWLNTPVPPLEASGTSGMKAALNGVPSLSVLDGWWIEGHVEDVTGWSLDGADELYRKLEQRVLPCFYREPARWLQIQRDCIGLNASYFNTQRMVLSYLYEAWLPPAR
jgi:starch phosphorylase